MFVGPWTRRAAAALVVVAFAAACRDRGRDEGDEGDTTLRDQAALEQIINHDLELDRILKEAEDFAARGDVARAADILAVQASPAAEATLTAASAAVVATLWARERRDALLALARDRRDAIPRYAAAIKSDDLDTRLGVIESQVVLERRAIELATSIARGPDAGSPAR